MNTSNYLSEILRHRRQKLGELIDFPSVLWSGSPSSRNFPANFFPFRANSHFLYFAGKPLENAAIRLEGGKLQLFIDNISPSSALWHGEAPSREEIATQIGADDARPMSELADFIENAATLPVQDAVTCTQQSQLLNRNIVPKKKIRGY